MGTEDGQETIPVLTPEQFSPQFDRLCAAFTTSKTEKTKDSWFEEFEECDYFTFCRAIKLLQRGDRFPNWGMIWNTYKPILPYHLQTQARKGCDDCDNGRVFFVDYIQDKVRNSKNGVIVYSMVGNCEICSKDVMKDCGNVSRKSMVQQGNGEYWTVRAIEQLPEEQKKVTKANEKAYELWKKDTGRRRKFKFND